MRRADGSARFAFVTLVMLNDSYLPGALMIGYALQRQSSQAERVCLITADVTAAARAALALLFDHVLEVGRVLVPYKRRQERQYIPYVFTRFHALRLGADGDLGPRYDKIVLLDADVLPLRCYDHLFTLPAPAGVLNERKGHFLDYDANGVYVLPPSVAASGTWRWHEVYDPICPHGQPIPREITERVREDPTNMGVNSALWVLEPSLAELNAILQDLGRPEVLEQVGDRFEWPDMQYATMRWSGRWHNVDLRFCGFSGYPTLAVLCGTHYGGFKPWAFKKVQAMARYARFEDLQFWFRQYRAMMTDCPALRQVKRLERLLAQIEQL